jgi:putative ubiquitin-RnfH superfamily antitoxin RatB of RatAB toxin-antitoxin module
MNHPDMEYGDDAGGIEVAYATPQRQALLRVAAVPGCTLRQAIERSGILDEFPEIDLERCRVGVFGHLRQLDDPVQAGDRVEIYRGLQADPKQARHQRARAKSKT